MSTENRCIGYAVTPRHVPGVGFTVSVSADTGETQKSPSQFSTLEAAFRLAQRTLADAGFSVTIDR